MNYSNEMAQQQYLKTGVETASQPKLIIMLYQGAVKFLNLAEKMIKEENYEKSNNHLIRVQTIVNELRVSLDREKGGEVAENLDSLYDYMHNRLIKANIEKDLEIIDEVRKILQELLESWKEAGKLNGKKKSDAAPGAKKLDLDIEKELNLRR